jgi:AraC-like DNA-binding protein
MEQAPLTVSTAYMAALMDAAGLTPLQIAHLQGEMNLPCEPRARLTEQQFSRLYRALAVALDDEMLHLFSRPLRPGALKFTCLGLLDAKKLTVALHRWSNLSRLVQDDFHLQLTTLGGTVRIAAVREPGAWSGQPFATDLMLKLVHGVCSWLVGRPLPLLRTDFPFPRPAFAADYELLYPGPVFFGQPEPAMVMDVRLLELPIRRSKCELDEFLLHAPEAWMFTAPSEPRTAVRLRRYLAERMPLPTNAETAAEALHLSVRTLHRRLADEDTSFQRVKDEFRRDMALQMLSTSQSPLNLISERLGFDSVASFHRAFRGWTGETPGAFRGTHSAAL